MPPDVQALSPYAYQKAFSLPRACMLTYSQADKVTVLKEASPSFVVMRRLAMRFRGLLRGADAGKLGSWLDDARHSGIQLLYQPALIRTHGPNRAGRWT